MRNTFSEALYQAATANPDVYVVVADISPAGSMGKFRDQYPDRFINVGVAEQSMIGICGGLALKGCQPFAMSSSIAWANASGIILNSASTGIFRTPS